MKKLSESSKVLLTRPGMNQTKKTRSMIKQWNSSFSLDRLLPPTSRENLGWAMPVPPGYSTRWNMKESSGLLKEASLEKS